MTIDGFTLELGLSFKGGITDYHQIDLYDLSRSLEGFHRTLALTAHYLLNDEIITHAPALKGASIYAFPAEPGSFKQKILVAIQAAAVTGILMQPNNTIVGHIMYSAYDYVVKTTLGFHVDLNEPLYKSYLQHESLKREIKKSKLESISDKCEGSLKDMHRPIYKTNASISLNITPLNDISDTPSIHLSGDTYDNLRKTKISSDSEMYYGRVSLYSANTRKGRIYIEDEQRTIPFHIKKGTYVNVATLSESLDIYTRLHDQGETDTKAGFFYFMARRGFSANNTTRFYEVTHIYKDSLERD